MEVIQYRCKVILGAEYSPVCHCSSAYLNAILCKKIFFLSVIWHCIYKLGIHHMCCKTGRYITMWNQWLCIIIFYKIRIFCQLTRWTFISSCYVFNPFKCCRMEYNLCTYNFCSYSCNLIATVRTDQFFWLKVIKLYPPDRKRTKQFVISCFFLTCSFMGCNFYIFSLYKFRSSVIFHISKKVQLSRKRCL